MDLKELKATIDNYCIRDIYVEFLIAGLWTKTLAVGRPNCRSPLKRHWYIDSDVGRGCFHTFSSFPAVVDRQYLMR